MEPSTRTTVGGLGLVLCIGGSVSFHHQIGIGRATPDSMTGGRKRRDWRAKAPRLAGESAATGGRKRRDWRAKAPRLAGESAAASAAAAQTRYEESLTYRRGLEDRRGIVWPLNGPGNVAKNRNGDARSAVCDRVLSVPGGRPEAVLLHRGLDEEMRG